MSDGITVIDAKKGWSIRELAETWRYRELLGFLAWRDIRVRYRQTFIGGAWALIEPLVSVVLFTLIFNQMAGFQTNGYPYALHCSAGMIIWVFFARALRDSSQSMVTNAVLVRKVFFPRIVLPISCVITCVVDFLCASMMYIILMIYYGVAPTSTILTVPLWIGLAGINVLGIGLMLSAINVRWRDISQGIPFLIQTWMFLTPVAYPMKDRAEIFQIIFRLNPMTGVVEGMRWALLPNYAMDWRLLIASGTIGVTMMIIGMIGFGKAQRSFADVV